MGWWSLGLLSAPWYRPPGDALGKAAAALAALFTLDLSTAVAPGPRGVERGSALCPLGDDPRSLAITHDLRISIVERGPLRGKFLHPQRRP